MHLELWQWLGLVAAGAAGGAINVMAGGGSIITVPAMIFLGVPGPVANGTNRVAILAQNLSAIRTFRRAGLSDIRLSLSLAACALPGAVAGAWFGTRLSGDMFNTLLAIIMVLVLVAMQTGGVKAHLNKGEKPRNLLLGHLLMVVAGFWGGFIQIGMGFILMPILNRVMGIDLITLNMHKVSIVAIYTTVALAVFAMGSEVLWFTGGVLAIGSALGGYVGAKLTINHGDRLIRRVMTGAIVVMIIKLLFFH